MTLRINNSFTFCNNNYSKKQTSLTFHMYLWRRRRFLSEEKTKRKHISRLYKIKREGLDEKIVTRKHIIFDYFTKPYISLIFSSHKTKL